VKLRRLHPLAVILAAGLVLRVLAMVAMTPAWLGFSDSASYVAQALAPSPWVEHPLHPIGYSVFLEALHAVWSDLALVSIAQHLLGLCTAAVMYATVRRLGGPRWAAAIPAGLVALSVDYVFGEHTPLTETLYLFLLSLALLCAACALAPGRRGGPVAWLAASGALLALATFIRPVALFVVPVVAGVALLAVPRPWRRRLAAAGTLAVTLGALLVGYSAVQHAQTGYFGISQGLGWGLYGRAAPFADCSRFTPPKGTEGLCETSDWRTRYGLGFYWWDPQSPARRLFVGPPYNDKLVGAFGRAAILHQPGLYARAVAKDLVHYAFPSVGYDRPGASLGPGFYTFPAAPMPPRYDTGPFAEYYGPVTVHRSGGVLDALGTVQRVVRLHGVLLVLALALVAAGLVWARGLRRWGIVLLGGSALMQLVLQVALLNYDYRYELPAVPALVAAAALAAAAVAERARRRSAALDAAGAPTPRRGDGAPPRTPGRPDRRRAAARSGPGLRP
jgi:4-amino-4-deoxy-L-arabinose transferase-like glycosyltransferase